MDIRVAAKAILAGLELPTKGSVTLDGSPSPAPGPERAVVFQNYSLLPWLTVEQNVSEAVGAACPNLEPLVQMGRVQTFLRAVGLWVHKDKRPSLEYAQLKSWLVYLLTEVLAVKDVH